jgi:hypothetical protein
MEVCPLQNRFSEERSILLLCGFSDFDQRLPD